MKPNYSLQSKFEKEERERQEHQAHCPHTFWSTRCGVCGKYLASDHHINFHTKRRFKKDNRVIILILDSPDLSLYRIQELKHLSQEYDEVTVLVDSIQSVEMYSAVKYPNRVVMASLTDEIKHMRKYRKEDVSEITLALYPDTKHSDELLTECKKLKISSITRQNAVGVI